MPAVSDPLNAFSLPWRGWYDGPEERIFQFPRGWLVEKLNMVGWPDTVAPDLDGLSSVVQQEVRSKESVSIAFDDLTRPTRLDAVLRSILDGVSRAGVRESQVDLVIALGAHGPPDATEVRKKVGDWVADRFPIRLHDARGDLAYTGLKLGNVPLKIDPHFLTAHYRIGIGSMLPNPFAGFSGGGKIVLPGLASIDALEWLHKLAVLGLAGGVGKIDGNRIRNEIEQVAANLPLHLSVQCFVDATRALREIHYGDPKETYRQSCARARAVYRTPMSGHYDILFCNAYPKDGEFLQAESGYSPLRTGALSFLSPGGSVVLMAACHKGRGSHGLFDIGMPLHRSPPGPKGYLRGTKAYIYAPGISEADCRVTHWEGYPHFDNWNNLVDALIEQHGSKARVGIFPAASCQLGPGTGPSKTL